MVEVTWPDLVILAAVALAVVVLAEVPHLYRQPAPCARRCGGPFWRLRSWRLLRQRLRAHFGL